LVKITWLGHSAFKLELADKTVFIDPWITGNPKAPIKASDITHADVICVTHDHVDHIGDAFDICKKTNSTFIATFELCNYAQNNGVKNVVGINIGGTMEVRGLKITMVQAFHTSTRGAPTGFVLRGEGKTIYHAGDTGLFGDMELIGELYCPNVALIPIGSYYTMGPLEAAEAVRLISPEITIPMHYQTFPVLVQSADEFLKLVKEKAPNVEIAVLKPGESLNF
jgi:L-ascorbate metabolism protein UlaG (beta-lactamase superfamily)